MSSFILPYDSLIVIVIHTHCRKFIKLLREHFFFPPPHPKITMADYLILGPGSLGMSPKLVEIRLIDSYPVLFISFMRHKWGSENQYRQRIHLSKLVCPFYSSKGCDQRCDEALYLLLAPKNDPHFKHHDSPPP